MQRKTRSNAKQGNDGKEQSDDDFMDEPLSTVFKLSLNANKTKNNEVRSKKNHDRPQHKKVIEVTKSVVEDVVPEAHKSKKRKNKEKDANATKMKKQAMHTPKLKRGSKKKKKSDDRPYEDDDKSGSDSDQECPKQKKRKKYDPTPYPKLHCRTSPQSLVNAIKSLTMKQRAAVKELGFENILNLSITEISSRLAYWAVDKFDSCSCELVLERGNKLQVDPVDVCRVFGFPMGDISITDEGDEVQTELIDDYNRIFGWTRGNKVKIVQKDIVGKMLADTEGGVLFKRHFMVLLVSSLIEHSSNGYVNPDIMQHLGDLDKVKDMDWCTYTFDCLARTKRAWENSKHKSFLGPTLFLTVFYVDRVKVFGAKVARAYPIIINWNDQLLRDRLNDELKDARLGCGRPLDPINVQHTRESGSSGTDLNHSDPNNASKEEKYAAKLAHHAKQVARHMVELIEMIESMPAGLGENDSLKRAVHTSQMLCTGGGIDTIATRDTQFDSTQADNFWGKADIMNCITELEEAHKKQSATVLKTNEIPSFSLGVTQISEGTDDLQRAEIGNKDMVPEPDAETKIENDKILEKQCR